MASSDADDPDVLTPTYQALMARQLAFITLRWQTLGLGPTAQGFVIGAASQIQQSHLPTAIMLALVILFLGLATIVPGQRFELLALADRQLLDVYEHRMLKGEHGGLRLYHATSAGARAEVMLRGPALDHYRAELRRGPLNRLSRIRSNHWWAYAQVIISIAGAAIPLFRYFGL